MRPVTIKLGGIAGQHAAGIGVIAAADADQLVVVHGGGNEVADWIRRLGMTPRIQDGLRVTDAPTMEVVAAVLGGLVNTRLVSALAVAGRPAIGLTGVDADLLVLRHREYDLGQVGEVVDVHPAILDVQLRDGLTPVVAPLGRDADGALLNVNADEVAGAIAAARGGLLLLCTDVPGVQLDGRVVERVDAEVAERMLGDGTASAGMRPKLRAALAAARAGCEVRIVDGRSSDALASALGGTPTGTLVTAS